MKTTSRPAQPPRVSIIIPVFNKCELTRQCLQAIADTTTHIPHEIIVVDNASSDATPQLMQKQPSHIHYFRNEANRNFAGACNQGAAAATGKYLLFLNNDTIPNRGWLEALLEEVRTHAEVAAVGSKLLYENGLVQHAGVLFARETRNPYHPYRLLNMNDPRVNRRRELQAVTAACLLIRPKWFNDCGGFSEDYRNGYEDLDLCLHIRRRGGVIVYQPKSVVFHLESQTPGRMKFDNENRALFFERWSNAVLSDDDACYFLDGYYRCGSPDTLGLRRFSDETERAQWQRVALSQTLAAQWQRNELVRVLSDDATWPQEASVRRWAGCLSRRLGIGDAAQRHFAAALALEEDGHVRLLAAAAGTDLSVPAEGGNLSDAALASGFGAWRAGKFAEARDAFELALFHGASPNLALAGLWQANHQAGAVAGAQMARQALMNLARLDPGTARKLAGGGTQKTTPAAASVPPGPKPAPVVSIVIPVFNNLALTRGCLDSLSRVPTEAAHEIIIVDNASADGTAEYLQEQEKSGFLRVLANPRNEGFARACNQGAQAARGSLLLFLNNDTRVTTGWLDSMVQAARRPHAGVVGARLLYEDNRIQHAGIGFINDIPDHPHRHASADAPEVNRFRELDMVTGACLLIQRELFIQLAGFDESYRNGVEDIDLCLRARAAGRKVVYEPKAVVYHLEGQSAGRFNHVSENLRMFFERWGKSFDVRKDFIVPKPARIIAASRSFLLESARPVHVAWTGSFLDHGSLSHVNRRLTQALKLQPGISISCVTNGAAVAHGFEDQAAEISITPPSDAAVTVRHAWPPDWKRPQQGKLVVIQPWEFGSLPEQWVKNAAKVDEFWVPSEYVRQVYAESGVPANKLVIVPNGVDLEQFHPQVAPMKLSTQKKFKLLFVGGTIFRKGPDLLLKAYLDNFTASDDVCLVIKDFGGQTVYAGQTFDSQIRAAQSQPNAPEILYLNEDLSPEALPGLYTACDCLVLPYRGEGFGLPALEAMACGLPVIVTAGGATDDFVRDDFAWRIPAERWIFGHEVSGLKLAKAGWLLKPDAIALGRFMREAFANPAETRRRGQLAAQHAGQFCSWQNAAGIAAQRIRELAGTGFGVPSSNQRDPTPKLKQPSHVKTAPAVKIKITLPPCALAGQLAEARELVRQKKYRAAWQAALSAMAKRPFHPEAGLLLAEIAQAVGDGPSAKLCAEYAHRMAPGWKPAKKFLSRHVKGGSKPEWLQISSLLDSPSSPRLSVCLIVKNEAKFLGQCLKSVRELAAQIVVVDTGSTDRTIEIAKEHGAEVHAFAWCDDFSAARNAALEQATGDWVLMLDADEELSAAGREELKSAMKDPAVMAWRLPIVDVGREADGCSYVPRFYRNAPGLFYVGRVHEQVFSSIEVRRAEWGLENRIGDAMLIHHGYTAELTRDRNKVERNLKLLERAIGELPDEPHLLMNLGLELARSGRETEALERYQQAFDSLSSKPAAEIVPELRETLLMQLSTRLTAMKRFDGVVRALTSPLAGMAGGLTASLHFSLGLAHLELKRFSEAADQMRQCLAKRNQRSLAPINREINTAAPHHCLALSLAKSGEPAAAEKSFQDGLKEPGPGGALRLDYARFLAGQNRPVEALQPLHEVVAVNPLNLQAWQLGGQIALSQPEFLEFARDWTDEAIKALPENPVIAAQRAEALMLSGDPTSAAGLWKNLWSSEPEPRTLAALILCEVVELPVTHAPNAGPDEQAASQAFIEWYRKLIAARATGVIEKINEHLEKLGRSLPSAAQMLEAALTEAAG